MKTLFRLALGVAALGVVAGIWLVVWLIAPRSPVPLKLRQPTTFDVTFDPHLELSVGSVVIEEAADGQRILVVELTAENSAAGDLEIDLLGLKVAPEGADGELEAELSPEWRDKSGEPLAILGQVEQAHGRVIFPLAGSLPVAIVIWDEVMLLRWLPLLRRGPLNPKLRLDLAERSPDSNP